MQVYMFHKVEPVLKTPADRFLSVTPECLARFIRVLRWAGVEPVSMRDVVAGKIDIAQSDQYCLLTFDDGFENFYEHAAPVFRALDCPATVFVLANRFAGTNYWDKEGLPVEKHDRLMSLAQMQELGEDPLFTFGSHGLDHTNLKFAYQSLVKDELWRSHEILSEKLGSAYVPVMAYPWGDYSPYVLEQIAASPYRYAMTVEKGVWTAQTLVYEIPRFAIFHRDKHWPWLMAKLIRYKTGRFDPKRWPELLQGLPKKASAPKAASL